MKFYIKRVSFVGLVFSSNPKENDVTAALNAFPAIGLCDWLFSIIARILRQAGLNNLLHLSDSIIALLKKPSL